MATTRPTDPIPLRAAPDQPDSADSQRIRLVVDRWTSQDDAYRAYERMVEEHVRMLAGRQWDVFVPVLGRYVDALRYMSEDERRWRQRPVMDYLRYWFQVALAKAIENPPIVSYQPVTLDRADAMLAEVADPIAKTCWDTTRMDDRIKRVVAWALCAGEGIFYSRPDFTAGPMIPPSAPAMDAVGGMLPPGELDAEMVPPDEGIPTDMQPVEAAPEAPMAPPQPEGELRVDVLCPLELRAEWGPSAWEHKRWMIQRWTLPLAEARALPGGADLDANTSGMGADDAGTLERLLFGSGYFGAVRQDVGGTSGDVSIPATKEMVTGYTLWEKPTPEFPEGRLTIVTPERVLWDSARPYAFECAGPYRKVEYLPMPGRPFASTPLEPAVPMQKRLNRIEAAEAEHANLCTNPVLLYQQDAVNDEQFVARPGVKIPVAMGSDVRAAAMWLQPPPLSGDHWRHKEGVRSQMFLILGLSGNEGEVPTEGASGELVEQLRFNSDRLLQPLTQSVVAAVAGVQRDWFQILPSLWTTDKLLATGGEDNVTRAVTVLPQMWEGNLHIRPVVESAYPESRGSRLQRVFQLYQMNAFGLPGSPEAVDKLLSLSRFPELTRASRPGGVDRVTAEHILGQLVRGELGAADVQVERAYNLQVHLGVVREFIASPEFRSLDEPIKNELRVYFDLLEMAGMAQMQEQTIKAGQMAATQAQVQGAVQATAMQALPPGAGPDDEPGAPGRDPERSRDPGQAAKPPVARAA